ncbi:MAG: DNA starvation/stationary phase protection protein [Campylobacteraceae bacterium]|jgi:starvation-inducible DNA-binding protein|nr:DNA starvation/stationary phase protection protein [Campylobacteraceae bacterium]
MGKKKVVEQLKSIQADAIALFVKIHNYHWNIKGLQFASVHAYTEGLYDKAATIYDDTAERILQLNSKPVLTLDNIAKITKIETEKGDSFDTKYIVENIYKDFTYLLEEFKNLSKLADEDGDKATAAYADDQIKEFEKELWKLKQTLK